MKLAFCLFNYFPHGGLQRDFMRIAMLCKQKGHEIHVYTMQWLGERPLDFIIHEQRECLHARQNHTRAYQFAMTLKHALKDQYDLVIGFNKMPGLDLYYAADGCFAEKLQAKSYSWLHHLLPRNRTYLALEKMVFQQTKRTQAIYISKKNQAEFQKHYPWQQSLLLPPGIDCHFKTLPGKMTMMGKIRNRLQLDHQKLQLLFVASRFKTKGLDRALIAIASLPKTIQETIQFNVIGHDHANHFIQLAKRLKIAAPIKYIGATNNIAEWMQASDLLLHPAYLESAGLTLLEAIACGLPIITTAICGYADYITQANAGIITQEPFSQKALNKALHEAITTPEALKRYSQNAEEFAKKADFYSMPDAVYQIIEELGNKNAHIKI